MVSTRPPTSIDIPLVPCEFFTSALADGLSLEFEYEQVSRTLLSILADLNYTVVWIISTRALISKSCSPCTYPFVTVPRTPFTTGINVTFMFHCFFFQFPNKVEALLLLAFFQFYSIVCRVSKVHYSASSLFFFFCYSKVCLVVWPRLDDSFVSHHSRRVCAIHLFIHLFNLKFSVLFSLF